MKTYTHYGWHLSYFSGKTRSYLKYKDIPFVDKPIDMYTYTVRARKRTNAAVMPVVVTPDGEWWQDTSEIIDRLEARFPDAPIVPATPVQKIASYLIEMWADEWWLPVAMYTRWWYPENYPLFEHDAGTQLLPYFPKFLQKRAGATAASAMRGHLTTIGVVKEQVDLLDRWTRDILDRFDAHFDEMPFLFGDRPSLGDFGLIGPLYAHLARDPWSKRELIDPRPHVRAWVDRMNNHRPRAGNFIGEDRIPETLNPVFRAIIDEFLPMLEGTLGEVNAYLPQHVESKLIPRGLGEIEFPMGEGRYRRRALPYVLWMVQRMLVAYRGMPATEQSAVKNWLRGLGGESLLDMKIPTLKRVGLRVAPC